jgi:hypothetical protein
VCGSKEPTVEEKGLWTEHRAQYHSTGCLIHFPASTKDTLSFKKSQMFTLSLKLSTLTFTYLWGYHLLFGREIFHKIKGRKALSRSHQDLSTTDNNTEWTESFSAATELHNACVKIESFCSWNFFWFLTYYLFFDHTWSKPHVTHSWKMWAHCKWQFLYFSLFYNNRKGIETTVPVLGWLKE